MALSPKIRIWQLGTSVLPRDAHPESSIGLLRLPYWWRNDHEKQKKHKQTPRTANNQRGKQESAKCVEKQDPKAYHPTKSGPRGHFSAEKSWIYSENLCAKEGEKVAHWKLRLPGKGLRITRPFCHPRFSASGLPFDTEIVFREIMAEGRIHHHPVFRKKSGRQGRAILARASIGEGGQREIPMV
jgi:hypothetical protein